MVTGWSRSAAGPADCSNKPLVARNEGVQLNARNGAVKTTPPDCKTELRE